MSRKALTIALVATIPLSLVAVTVAFIVTTWTRSDAQLSVHDWIALALGVLLLGSRRLRSHSLDVYSSRSGYEQAWHRDNGRIPK